MFLIVMVTETGHSLAEAVTRLEWNAVSVLRDILNYSVNVRVSAIVSV